MRVVESEIAIPIALRELRWERLCLEFVIDSRGEESLCAGVHDEHWEPIGWESISYLGKAVSVDRVEKFPSSDPLNVAV